MSDPSNTPPAAAAPVPAAPPTRRRTRRWIAVGIVAAITLVGIVIAVMLSNVPVVAARTPAATPTPAVADEDVASTNPESPSAPQGALGNPYPAGFAYVISNQSTGVDVFAVAFRLLPVAEQSELIVGAGTEPAPAGMRNEVVEYTVTGLNPDELVDPGREAINWQLVDQNGTVYESLLVMATGGDAGELPAGQTWTAQALFQVPAVTTNLFLLAYGAYTALE